jgi:hypothetical protein
MDRKGHASKFFALPLRIFAFGLATLPVGAAWADCKPVIAAYTAADATRHFAFYNADGMTKANKGEPIKVILGETEYVENDVRKGALEIVMDGYKKSPFSPGFEANSVRDDEKKGKIRCEPLGVRNVGTEALIGYHVRTNDNSTGLDPFAYDIWVNRTTGLPAFYGVMGSDGGGFRWVYGTQVTAPPPGEIRH